MLKTSPTWGAERKDNMKTILVIFTLIRQDGYVDIKVPTVYQDNCIKTAESLLISMNEKVFINSMPVLAFRCVKLNNHKEYVK
jgi:hypothetical protein